MSYLVLARKYRPRSFTEMVGQAHVVQALTNALTQQRLHHAYLFTGTRGVGKTTVSRILAKSLNCTGADGSGGITAQPCGVCPACTEIDAGRFVDYTELDAASNRGVDEVQQLLEQAVYKPVQGRFKVFMIDEVHMLSNTAFNAMLKTLEEPPEYLKFVLATTDPQKVPPTVLSRCLQFNLRPMAPETVLDHLTRVLAEESVPAEPQALKLLARAARGSMRDALSLTDQAIAFGSGQLQESAVRQMLGSVNRSVVFRLIEALSAADGRTVVELTEQLRAAGLSAATTLEDMASVLQRMAVHQAVPGMATDDTDPDAQETARLAALLPADETQLLYSLCIHGRAELGLAPDEYAGLTMVLLRLLPFKAPGGAPAHTAPHNTAPSSAAAEKKTLKTAEAPFVAPSVASPVALPVTTPAARPGVPSVESSAVAPPSAPVTAAPEPPAPATPAPAPTIAAPSDNADDDDGPEPAPWDAQPADEPPPSDWDEDIGSAPAPPATTAVAARTQPVMRPLPVRDATHGEASTTAVRAPASSAAQAQTPAPAPPPLVAVKVRDEQTAEHPAPRSAPAAEPLPVQGGPDNDFWHTLVQSLVAREAVTALVRELALQSQLVTRTPDAWTLRLENETLAQSAARQRLQAALADAGHAVRLHVDIGPVTDTPARRNAIAATQRLKAAESLLMADPFVQEMTRDFGARVVPGTLKPL
ncbi:MAG: DNA polymerase III subunit gamma/tau [Pseudomonadota bacterium]|nr:DNA polymerase III subunit gamma/tau [Pseudomonadota bacterium]